jgi:hypothetical protein
MTVKLHVGYVGTTREGKRVEIVSTYSGPNAYRYTSNTGQWYLSSGRIGQEKHRRRDIVGPWVDAPVITKLSPLVDYNDGKWHRWAGGECPVHNDTLVDATYLSDCEGVVTCSRSAYNFVWDSGDGPIVAFRVTKKYVEPPKEPREFWLLSPNKHGYNRILETIPLGSDKNEYIHVREIIE